MPKKKKEKRSARHELRETVESIIVAFILAFLFRTFEAEAFVIPTGSMAPTLRGRHKEADCPKCGHHIVVGASDEVDRNGYLEGNYVDRQNREFRAAFLLDKAVCPNCRYQVPIKDLPVFTGDRILVNKWPFEISLPERWDVIVFKYPEHPKTNYIKRLIGLPGEEIHVRQGNVYASRTENGPIEILRKDDPDKQKVLQILVYDDNHAERALHEHGWPQRWASVVHDPDSAESYGGWREQDGGWETETENRTHTLSAANAGARQWLRYRHIVPRYSDWQELDLAKEENRDPQLNPRQRVQLVTDFCGYNAYTGGKDSHVTGMYWVGDLTLSCELTISEATTENAEVILELNEGVRRYRCRFNLSNGTATLYYPDPFSREETDVVELGSIETDVKGTGSWDVKFANVDDRLCLWVDGSYIDFGETDDGGRIGEYSPHGALPLQQPVDADLAPVGIAVQGAAATVGDLLIERDIYYRAEYFVRSPHPHPDNPGEGTARKEYLGSSTTLNSKLANPAAWYEEYKRNSDQSTRFARLGDDEFFVMGDNSPRSQDSRLWSPARLWRGIVEREERRHSVPRSALVGKAFFVYWPHGVPFLNDGKGYGVRNHRNAVDHGPTDYPYFHVPFYPDITRMRRIR